jgi:hypothetical protein
MASTSLQMLQKTGNNAQSDECYTPPEAVEPLLPYMNKYMTWYEATSGLSKSIVECMRGHGFLCHESRGDFFDVDVTESGIITNPPYSKKDKFLRRCYELDRPFALLLPVSSIQGERRGKMFREHGIDLLVLSKRIDFTGKGAPHFGVAWFTKGILPEPLIFA